MLFVGWDEGSVPLTQHGGNDKGAIQLSTPVSTNKRQRFESPQISLELEEISDVQVKSISRKCD